MMQGDQIICNEASSHGITHLASYTAAAVTDQTVMFIDDNGVPRVRNKENYTVWDQGAFDRAFRSVQAALQNGLQQEFRSSRPVQPPLIIDSIPDLNMDWPYVGKNTKTKSFSGTFRNASNNDLVLMLAELQSELARRSVDVTHERAIEI